MFKELSEELDTIKKTQPEMEDPLIKIKNNLQENNSREDEGENQINIWNIRKQKTTNCNKNKKESKENEDSVSSLWDNFKCSFICMIGVPEGEEKEQEIRNLFEKNERKFP